MATSGTITFNETLTTIVTNSLTLLGVVAAGETATTQDMVLGTSLLNQMVKAWMAQGIHLWTEEQGQLFFVNGQASYNVATGSSYAFASDGSGTPTQTTVTTTVASGTSLVVGSVTGMSVGDNIGIQLSTNVLQWTTISAINTNLLTVTLGASLTGTATAGNQVFTYTTQLPRPISVQTAQVHDSNGFDRRIKIITRQEYEMIPQKTIPGLPVVLYYSPQLNNGTIFLWPAPSDVSTYLSFTYLRTIQDFVNSTDNPDFPQEWLECIVYNLAVRLAPAYGINLSSGGISGNPDILRQAAQYLDDLKAWDTEQPYMRFIPNYRSDRY